MAALVAAALPVAAAATLSLAFHSPDRLIRRWQRLRVQVIYRWRHGRWPSLDRPRTFTEWVQWRKLRDRSLDLALLTDKIHAKAHARARLGADHVVPLLWSGLVLPEHPPAPLPLIVKAAHGCNQFRVIRTPGDWQAARRAAPAWLRTTYGAWLDEWHYRAARPALLVEPFLGGEGAGLPVDYKIYVFGGRARIVQMHVGRADDHRWTQFDRDWRTVGGAPSDAGPPPNLHAMIAAAETLAAGHDFLRVDFFDVAGHWWFGEYCLYPGSGLDPFDPPALDLHLGRKWSEARARA